VAIADRAKSIPACCSKHRQLDEHDANMVMNGGGSRPQLVAAVVPRAVSSKRSGSHG
jgi:hypothetical protein